MKGKIRLVSVLVLMVALGLSFAINASVSANQVPVTGEEIPLCFQAIPHPECTAGEWTFPGGNQHVRNWVLVYKVVSSDDRIAGTNTLVANANWDANGYGPGWGTFHNEIDKYDGYWEGTWSANMTEAGYVSRIVGKGHGDLDGLMFHATELNGIIDGMILEPSAR